MIAAARADVEDLGWRRTKLNIRFGCFSALHMHSKQHENNLSMTQFHTEEGGADIRNPWHQPYPAGCIIQMHIITALLVLTMLKWFPYCQACRWGFYCDVKRCYGEVKVCNYYRSMNSNDSVQSYVCLLRSKFYCAQESLLPGKFVVQDCSLGFSFSEFLEPLKGDTQHPQLSVSQAEDLDIYSL